MSIRTIALGVLIAVTSGCAAIQPITPGAPRGNQPPYPAMLAEATQRIDSASSAWNQITAQQGLKGKSEVPLQPITSTIRSFPDNFNGPLYLPKVGASAQMSEEETRESLRRFLNEWRPLLGVDPAQLTLITDVTTGDGTRTARYEQRPFSFPLRGDYGKVEVRFAPDRRILNVSSSAIPDTARIQTSLNAASIQIRSQDLTAKLAGLSVPYTDSSGTHTFTISSPVQVTAQQLVVYPRKSPTAPDTLEIHLVWELSLANAPIGIIYFDSLQGAVIASGS